MAQQTRLTPLILPGRLYGSFSGKAEAPVVPAPVVLAPATRKVTTYEVRLLDSLGNTLDIIDEWLSLEYIRVINDIGSLTLILDGSYPNPKFIKVDGRIIIFRNGQIDTETAWLIRKWNRVLDAQGRRQIIIVAVSATELLDRRVVAYKAGTTQSSKSDKADSLMTDIMVENFGASATDTDRDMSSYLTVQTSPSLGPTVTKDFSYDNILGLFQEISQTTINAGSGVYFDIIAPTISTLEFRTYRALRGIDHSFPNGLNPVVLSPERGNLVNVQLTFDRTQEINFAYAGGQQVGELRDVQTASNIDRINESPFNRRETFLNSSGNSASSAVLDDAQAKVREGRPRRTFAGELVNVPGATEYGVHWSLGDKVTAQAEGESLNCTIDAVHISFSNGKETINGMLRVEEDD